MLFALQKKAAHIPNASNLLTVPLAVLNIFLEKLVLRIEVFVRLVYFEGFLHLFGHAEAVLFQVTNVLLLL